MSCIEIGDRIIDNKPCMKGRTLIVIAIVGNYVAAMRSASTRVFLIRKDRIFTDGKPRRSGFSFISDKNP
jgi:hypothetical protein